MYNEIKWTKPAHLFSLARDIDTQLRKIWEMAAQAKILDTVRLGIDRDFRQMLS